MSNGCPGGVCNLPALGSTGAVLPYAGMTPQQCLKLPTETERKACIAYVQGFGSYEELRTDLYERVQADRLAREAASNEAAARLKAQREAGYSQPSTTAPTAPALVRTTDFSGKILRVYPSVAQAGSPLTIYVDYEAWCHSWVYRPLWQTRVVINVDGMAAADIDQHSGEEGHRYASETQGYLNLGTMPNKSISGTARLEVSTVFVVGQKQWALLDERAFSVTVSQVGAPPGPVSTPTPSGVPVPADRQTQYQCSACGQYFFTAQELADHYSLMHQTTPPPTPWEPGDGGGEPWTPTPVTPTNGEADHGGLPTSFIVLGIGALIVGTMFLQRKPSKKNGNGKDEPVLPPE